MKHVLPFLMLLLVGCKKHAPETKCYECDMQYADNTPAGQQYPCTDDLEKWKHTVVDNYGNPMQADCKVR